MELCPTMPISRAAWGVALFKLATTDDLVRRAFFCAKCSGRKRERDDRKLRLRSWNNRMLLLCMTSGVAFAGHWPPDGQFPAMAE